MEGEQIREIIRNPPEYTGRGRPRKQTNKTWDEIKQKQKSTQGKISGMYVGPKVSKQELLNKIDTKIRLCMNEIKNLFEQYERGVRMEYADSIVNALNKVKEGL